MLQKEKITSVIKFVIFFVIIFFIGRLLKISLLSIAYDGEISKVPYQLFFIFASIPNLIFYFFVGSVLLIVMKTNVRLWIVIFCVIELTWQLILEKPVFVNASIYEYLEVYVPRILIPVAVMSGVWITKKIITKENAISLK